MERSVLIVEDEPLIADDLSFHLEDMGVEHIDVSLKYDEALQKVSAQNFDLALLDVNLSGDKDGIEFARYLNEHKPTPFIFITSYYDEGTISRAKSTNPHAYIVKPFDQKDIVVNVEMAFHKIKLSSSLPDRFFIKDKDGLIPVEPSEIRYVEAFDNYAKVFTIDQYYIVSHTLKSIEDKLTPYGFERIHKSYLINFTLISRICEGQVYFHEKSIPIGRAYKNAFLSKIALL
ncbi:MAG: response regulator [Bacteroidota bacterium]